MWTGQPGEGPGQCRAFDRVFRLVHTIKGGRVLDLLRLASVTHAVEDLLGQMRASARPSAAW